MNRLRLPLFSYVHVALLSASSSSASLSKSSRIKWSQIQAMTLTLEHEFCHPFATSWSPCYAPTVVPSIDIRTLIAWNASHVWFSIGGTRSPVLRRVVRRSSWFESTTKHKNILHACLYRHQFSFGCVRVRHCLEGSLGSFHSVFFGRTVS